ncbi:M48 family metalloprotease [Streptomyces sp. NPDC000983]|uniref:M48 family metalloprotease n=1 Tax=Streptomyces sp. NPDC000983 TaxID=3154373 RepID=UPI003324DD08
MTVATEGRTQRCPQCGAEVSPDERFAVWCAACDWNVDPARPEERHGWLERAQRAQARRHGERLFAEMTADGGPRARRDIAALLARAVALAVHGLTLALAVAGVWSLLSGGVPGIVLGLFLLLLAWALRPCPNRLPDDAPVLRRADAPELNASVTTYGLRGRRALLLGLPLWEILTPPQRIALLGHEIGHFGNGDTRHGLIVGTALRSLTSWRYYFSPTPEPTLVQMAVNLVTLVPGTLVLGVLLLLDRLTLRAAQRAEYLADRVAVRAGSAEAAVGLMDRLLVVDSAAVTLRREANGSAKGARRPAADAAEALWHRLAADMASIPEHEYERRRRAGALRGHSVDATHPPTHLRRASLLTAAPAPAAVVMDSGREQRIAAELADARGRVTQRILRHGFAARHRPWTEGTGPRGRRKAPDHAGTRVLRSRAWPN